MLCLVAMSTALAAIAPGESGAAEERRSGTVLAIDHTTAVLLLRVGPWRMKEQDAAAVSPTRIALTPSTSVLLVNHASSAGANARPGDVVETSSDAEALRPGVFATVIFTQTGAELVALRIEVLADPLRPNRGPLPAPLNLTIQSK